MELKPNEQYSIGFDAAGRTFQMDVHLSALFPSEAPHLEISPLLQHPWVQPGTGTIQSAPGLVNVSPNEKSMRRSNYIICVHTQFTLHSDLGRVVQAIIREFQRSTGTSTQSSSSASSSSTTTPTTPAIHPHHNHNNSSSSSSKNTPPASAENEATSYAPAAAPPMQQLLANMPAMTLPDLSALSLDELRQLNEPDAQYLVDFVEELDGMQQLNGRIDELLADVQTASGDNLAKESELLRLQQAKQSGRLALRRLGADYEAENQSYQTQSEQFAPAHIKELLQIAAAGADADCEAHVAAFLGGRLDAATFLERYMPAKVLGTVRKAKVERLAHQLSALERSTF